MIDPKEIVSIVFLAFMLIASIVIHLEVRKQPKRKSPMQRCEEHAEEMSKRQGKITIIEDE